LINDFQETAADRSDGRVPKLGMNFFLSEDEGYCFYNKYAETICFSIRRGNNGHLHALTKVWVM
jgi:hypothetical protein